MFKVLVLLVASVSGLATCFSATAQQWEARFFNPKPIADDVVLALPCDGAMTFRKVLVPGSKPLDDFGVTLGAEESTQRHLEQAHPAHIAGSFTAVAPATGRYYLIGKYEVTELQYQAVMQESCPKPTMKLMLPKTGLSWFDAMQFSDRLNIWLRKNALDKLPKEDGAPGFVRLPTEVEWEFAARGGNSVGSAEFRESRYPMADGMNKNVWFAGSQSANGKLQLVGLLAPNPLGLHDILGNADEMMFEPFRLNKLDRFHGQAGGFIVRGANYLTPEADIRTAWRQEQVYYQASEPNRPRTSGFRLALVSPALTSVQRSKQIEQDWAALGTAPVTAPTPGAGAPNQPAGTSTLDRLSSLMSGLKDDKLKKELEALRTELRSSNQVRDEQRGVAIRSALQQGAFMCVLANREGRFFDALSKNYQEDCSKAESLSEPDQNRCKVMKRTLDGRRAAQDLALNLYSDTIVEAGTIYTMAMIEPEARAKKQQLLARKSNNLDAYLDTYVRHLSEYIKDKKVRQDSWLTTCKAVVNN
jgi:hypothetical protein